MPLLWIYNDKKTCEDDKNLLVTIPAESTYHFKNKEIIPLIGHNAAVLGDCDVADQCNRILNIL